MPRVTVMPDDALVAELDPVIAARGGRNRSDAIRDLARAAAEPYPASGMRPGLS